MKITMMQKLLATFICLMLGSIVAISGMYYSFFTRYIEMQARKQSEIAFDLVFDSIRKKVTDSLPQIETFIKDTVEGNLNIINAPQERYDFASMTDEQLHQYLPSIFSRYRNIVSAVDQFAPLLGANKLVIYDKKRKTRVAYLDSTDRKQLGIYLDYGSGGTFIPFGTQQLSSVGSQLLKFLYSQEIRRMLRMTLPKEVSVEYEGIIPKTTLATISRFGSMATIKFIVPLSYNGELSGICELQIGIRQNEVESFARFSQTEVNIFAGTTLSVGTFAEYDTLSFNNPPTVTRLDFSDFQAPSINFSEITIAGKQYSQGSVVIGETDSDFIVITANFPRRIITQQRNRLLISILLVAVTCGLVAFIVSGVFGARVNSFVQRLLLYLNRLAKGDVPEKITESYKGEDVFEEWRPHFIWMDRRIPLMDGLEATRRIKAMEGGKEAIIVALTASVFKEQRDEVLEAGCDDFLRKPFREVELFGAMEKHLGVRYVYAEEQPTATAEAAKMDLPSSEVLAALTPELLASLLKAVEEIDLKAAEQVISWIGASNKALAESLAYLVRNFRFDTLQNLIMETMK